MSEPTQHPADIAKKLEELIHICGGAEKRYQQWLGGKGRRKDEHHPNYSILVPRSVLGQAIDALKQYAEEKADWAISMEMMDEEDEDNEPYER